jgi:hypothetical protein
MGLWLTLLRIIGRPVALRLLAILALVELIFLTESFEGLLRKALEFDASARDFLWILALQAPEISSLAFAIALVVALFFSTQDARQNAELLVLTSAGMTPTHLLVFFTLLCSGLAVMVWALVGIVVPEARYQQRQSLQELQRAYLTTQMTTPTGSGQIASPDGTMFVATLGEGLLIYSGQSSRDFQLGTADSWSLQPPDRHDGPYTARLQGFTGYESATTGRLNQTSTKGADIQFSLADLIPSARPERDPREQTLFEGTLYPETTSRALQVLLAGLSALGALCLRRGRIFALPLAILMTVAFEPALRALPDFALLPVGLGLSATMLAALRLMAVRLIVPIRG